MYSDNGASVRARTIAFAFLLFIMCKGATGQSPTFTEYPILTANSQPNGIVTGLDGALWFVEFGGNKIGRITTDGTIREFPVPTAISLPRFIAAASDGALWFTEGAGNKIGRITTDGVVTEYP